MLSLLAVGRAEAGYIIQPGSGATTGAQPSFLVYLDSNDSLAEVHVGTSAAVDSYGNSPNEIGSCYPRTPFGEPDKFTCAPSSYAPTYGATLAPGTYYWWMSYWRKDPDHPYGAQALSGPYPFTVVAPTAPAGAGPTAPASGAIVSPPFDLEAEVPDLATVNFYLSDQPGHYENGTPTGTTVAGCEGKASGAGIYTCTIGSTKVAPGSTYYWWVTIDLADGTGWIYNTRSLTIKKPKTQPPPDGGGVVDWRSAAKLPSVDRWRGSSAKHRKLSAAVYKFSRLIEQPKTLAVACWSDQDWPSVSGDAADDLYSIFGLYVPTQPHWLHLSPSTCRGLQTLLTNKPQYPNRITANALDTLTHETIHALGIANEAKTECYSMQTSPFMAAILGLGGNYGQSLARLSLKNYPLHPAAYVDRIRCRENGAWDLWPNEPSPPWHNFAV